MVQSRMGRIALTAVAIFAVWGVAAVIFVRIGRGRPQAKTAAPPLLPRKFDFTSWPTPDLALVITGQQHGYLEPCGCTEGQKGGIGRRHNLIKRLEDRGWPVGRADLGGLIGYRSGRQAELKYQTALTALQTLGYQSLGLGLGEINLPAGSLYSEVTSVPIRVPILSANLSIFETEFPPSHHLFEAGEVEVGVAAVFGEKYLAEKQNDEIEWSAPAEALQSVVEPLKDADLRILLVYGPIDETKALANQFTDFEIVVTAGGAEEPADPKSFDGDRLFVETGEKGKSVILVAYYRDSEPRFRSELVPLDSRFRDTPEWEEQLAAYVSVLKDERLVETTQRQLHPDGAEFVGAETCGECHTSAYAIWEKTKHALATQVLLPKDRHYDPECIRCHATGWDPQLVIPWETGYVSMQATPHLVGNGCENCHGPGSKHVEAEEAKLAGQVPGDLGELRRQMRVDREYAEKNLCIRCHDADNSHDYEFSTYWPKVVHRGVK